MASYILIYCWSRGVPQIPLTLVAMFSKNQYCNKINKNKINTNCTQEKQFIYNLKEIASKQV